MASRERGRPARTKPGTASAISPTWNQSAAAPCLCFGRAHAVPAGRAVGCNIAGKLSGNRRDSMRAGRPRSRGVSSRWGGGGYPAGDFSESRPAPFGNLPFAREPGARPPRLGRSIEKDYKWNIDTQDRQDKQDEKLLHKKLTGSIIECAFVENLSVLRGPSWTPFESIPTPWDPFADSSFCPLNRSFSVLGGNLFSPPNLWRIPLELSPTP